MPKGRLLVADPSPRFLDRTRDLLEAAGYDMTPAEDGQAALAHVETGQADAVLAAVHLPRLSGYDLCRSLKKLEPTIPCVLMFDRGDARQPARVWQAGAENYLVRPLKRSELLFAVRDMLAMSNLLKQRASLREERDQLADAQGGNGDVDLRTRFFQFEFFKKLLAIEIKRARRYRYPLSLVLVGLDAEGNGEDGPSMRRGLTEAVRSAIRDIDIPVTFSQGSLLVVMPHTDKKGALVVGERIRDKVRDRADATASVVVVSTDGSPRYTFSALISAAAKGLEAARGDGGDRVVAL